MAADIHREGAYVGLMKLLTRRPLWHINDFIPDPKKPTKKEVEKGMYPYDIFGVLSCVFIADTFSPKVVFFM